MFGAIFGCVTLIILCPAFVFGGLLWAATMLVIGCGEEGCDLVRRAELARVACGSALCALRSSHIPLLPNRRRILKTQDTTSTNT